MSTIMRMTMIFSYQTTGIVQKWFLYYFWMNYYEYYFKV